MQWLPDEDKNTVLVTGYQIVDMTVREHPSEEVLLLVRNPDGSTVPLLGRGVILLRCQAVHSHSQRLNADLLPQLRYQSNTGASMTSIASSPDHIFCGLVDGGIECWHIESRHTTVSAVCLHG